MLYSIERIYNLERRIPGWPPYENLKLRIDEAESAKEAEKEIENWAKDLITEMTSKMPKPKPF